MPRRGTTSCESQLLSGAYLSDREKSLIARAAGGEYAVHDTVRDIYRIRSRSAPPDCPYMAFLRVLLSRGPSIEEVIAASRPILKLHPFAPPPPLKKGSRTKANVAQRRPRAPRQQAREESDDPRQARIKAALAAPWRQAP